MNWGGGNIKALSANNVENGRINFDKECYVGSEELYKIWMNKGDCEKGDVIITMEAPLGNIAQIPDDNKYILSQRTLLFKTKKEFVDNDFFFFVLSDEDFQNQLKLNSSGSTVTGIQQKRLAKLKVKLPSKTQQRKIARILSTADAVIEKTRATIAKYKAVKQGMLHDLFTRGIDTHTGVIRPKPEDAPKLYRDSLLGKVPKVWEVERLEDLSTQIGDGIHTTPKYSENTDYYFINGNNLSDGEIVISENTLCINEEEYKKHFKELNERTILYSINGTIGNIAVYNGQKVVLGKSACYISCKTNINLAYIYFILQTEPIAKFYENESTGSTIKNLSLASVRNTPIPFPKEEEEQNAIAGKIAAVNKKLRTEQNYLSKLQSIKAGLMADLLSGKKPMSIEEPAPAESIYA